MRDFHRLKVWARAHRLVLNVYRVTRAFPRDEMYGLTSQMRRSASSICANIAEGCGRDKRPDFARFLDIAMGSASELEYHVLLSADLEFLPHATFGTLNAAVVEVKRTLAGLLRTLRADG